MTDDGHVVADFPPLEPEAPLLDQVPPELRGFDPAHWMTDAERASGINRVLLGRARQRQRTVQAEWCHYAGVRWFLFRRWLDFITDRETL